MIAGAAELSPVEQLERFGTEGALLVADLRGELAAREAEVASLRLAVARPGYDPSAGAVVGKRPRAGRPRVVTPDVQAKLLMYLRHGNSRATACKLVRISGDSLANAMRSDPLFKADVARAESLCLARAAKCLTTAGKDDPKYALEILRRRDPDTWAMPAERVTPPNVSENRAMKDDALAVLTAALIGPVEPGELDRPRGEDEDEEPDALELDEEPAVG